jgi:branched-chain amino acid transport system substrate-binding protein
MFRCSAPGVSGPAASRRRLLRHGAATAAVLGLPGLAATAAWAQQAKSVIRIGCTNDMSTSERVNTDALHDGARVAFEAFNREGGWNGRRCELVRLDDQFKPELTAENTRRLAGDPSVLALLQPLGTRQIAAAMDAVKDLAIVGPNSGTTGLRSKPSDNTFFVRADYDQEIHKLIDTARALGMTRIGAVAAKDPFGDAVLKGLDAAVKALGVPAPAIAYTPGTGSPEVKPAALELAKANPQLVLVFLGGTAAHFVTEFRTAGGSSTVYGLSIGSSPAVIERMGVHARGFGFAMVVPAPHQSHHAVVRNYQRDAAAAGVAALSLPGMEGYINARVLIEGMRRAPGNTLTRESVLAGLRRIDALDLGGFRLSYAESRRGSQFVDVGVVGANGRILT